MITGLKITVPGIEVQKLLQERADHHTHRAAQCRQTWETLAKAYQGVTEENAPKMSGSTDPVKNAKDGMERHENKAREYVFMAKFLNLGEEYLLDATDLHRLGVLASQF